MSCYMNYLKINMVNFRQLCFTINLSLIIFSASLGSLQGLEMVLETIRNKIVVDEQDRNSSNRNLEKTHVSEGPISSVECGAVGITLANGRLD